jgi:hypothetical protein
METLSGIAADSQPMPKRKKNVAKDLTNGDLTVFGNLLLSQSIVLSEIVRSGTTSFSSVPIAVLGKVLANLSLTKEIVKTHLSQAISKRLGHS